MAKRKNHNSLESIARACEDAEGLLESINKQNTAKKEEIKTEVSAQQTDQRQTNSFGWQIVLLICVGLAGFIFGNYKEFESGSSESAPSITSQSNDRETKSIKNRVNSKTDTSTNAARTITPLPTREPTVLGIKQREAEKVVEKWLTVKSQIFAPPFDINIADRIVAMGPLWDDLTKDNGSISWLKNNSSHYTYPQISINQIINYTPSQTAPSIALSITESANLHSPNGVQKTTRTNRWLYTLKKERGIWKIWDYKKI